MVRDKIQIEKQKPGPTQRNGTIPRIAFAVVLYNMASQDSSTLQSLSVCLRSAVTFDYTVLVFDNSEVPIDAPNGIPNCLTIWCGYNRGLAGAYNDALAFSARHGAEVLVTLDQDSVVTPAYLSALAEGVATMREPVVVLCPKIRSHGRLTSPFVARPLKLRRYGLAGAGACAINSFSAYSVRFLQSIKGVDEFYWLDGLDYSTFARIHRAGKCMALLDVEVEHNLSLLSGGIGISRLRSTIFYEACYLLEYAGPLHWLTSLPRLLARGVRVAPHGASWRYLGVALRSTLSGGAAGMRRRLGRARAQ